MDSPGIIGLLGLGATLLVALPIGIFGLHLLVGGRTLLGGFGVAVAVGLVVVERVLWTPGDVLPEALTRVVDSVVRRPPRDR